MSFVVSFLFISCGATNQPSKSSDTISNIDYKPWGYIAEHGSFSIQIPSTWNVKKVSAPHNFPSTFSFRANQGDSFTILLTPIYNKSFNSSKNIKYLMQKELKTLILTAVNKDEKLKKLTKSKHEGYYFQLLDSRPIKKGEYKYVVRLGIGAGKLLISATILTNEKNLPAITHMINALKNAKIIDSPPKSK